MEETLYRHQTTSGTELVLSISRRKPHRRHPYAGKPPLSPNKTEIRRWQAAENIDLDRESGETWQLADRC